MNREDIIRMARESGMELYGLGKNRERFIYHLERFAALIAAAEREKVARWQIGSGYSTGHGDTIEDLLVELEWQVRESEREACAKVCEEVESRAEELWDKFAYPEDQGMASGARQCAAAIQARGNT